VSHAGRDSDWVDSERHSISQGGSLFPSGFRH